MKLLHWWALVVLLLGSTAWSQQGAAPDLGNLESERLRIDTARQQKISELDVEESACSAKFAVTDCQNKVNARRRQLLSDLKRQEASLNAIERRQKGLDQTRRAEDKAADSAARRQESQTTPGSAEQNDRKKVQDEKILSHQQQANPVGGQPPASKSTSALKPAEVDANRAAYAEKQNALEKRRKDRDQRLLDKGAGGPPLPVAP